MTLLLIACSACASWSDNLGLSWQAHDVGRPGEPWWIGRLTIQNSRFPGGKLEVTYPEAYCRSGSTNQSWKETVIPQLTRIVHYDATLNELHLLSEVGPNVIVEHIIRAGDEVIDFRLKFINRGNEPVDLEWAQTACLRVGEFTGLSQFDYFNKCFIFTRDGLTMMNSTHRATEGYYTPGQVYAPEGTDLDDVNPRPISRTVPVNGLIGCFSSDGSAILATAWEPTHELFQGVLNCIHNDPHIGGLQPGETKHIFGKIYIMANDPERLLDRYEQDFPQRAFSPGTTATFGSSRTSLRSASQVTGSW